MANNSASLSLKGEKGYLAAIAIALVIVAASVAGYLITHQPQGDLGYNTLYLLDSNNQATDYPNVLVTNFNSTFTVPVTVTNHMVKAQDYELQIKITQSALYFPVDAPANSTYSFSLKVDEVWQTQAPITINQPGNYAVVFELWSKDSGADTAYSFTGNFNTLNLQVVPNQN